MSISHDCKLVATSSVDRSALIWDLNSGNLIKKLDGHNGRVSSISFSHDSKYLITGSDDKSAIIWDID